MSLEGFVRLVNRFKWNAFPRKKPPRNGWYLCTVEVYHFQRYTMDLYWYNEGERFLDNRRRDVFHSFNVYGDDGLKKEYDNLCDRTKEVVAWRELPPTYMKGFVKDE